MIEPKDFYDNLIHSGIDFFCGVPDSLLKDFCAYVTANTSSERNLITVNEGAAIGLAAGYHIGSGKIPVVYMQNSGLGNATNPLLSLADSEVYGIPVLLIIGWRGEPGIKDEPQHIKQGKVTLGIIEAMGIKYSILDSNTDYVKAIGEALNYCSTFSSPYAFVVRKDTFKSYRLEDNNKDDLNLSREEALEIVLNSLPENAIIVSTTGMLSRELFELRERRDERHDSDFLTVGSMGHTSQIAAGIAISNPDKSVYCFEGDGGGLMHLGSYAFLGSMKLPNLKIVMFNNGAHDSVGGQPTIGFLTSFPDIFRSFGFKKSMTSDNESDLKEKIGALCNNSGPSFLEIKVRKGARKDLGRPSQTPLQTKLEFMKLLGSK
jgi:phosphonopyruvate decarboxylase